MADKETVLTVDNVSVKYRLTEEKVDNLKEYVIRFLKRDLKYKDFLALDGVSFSLEKGDRLAILGSNGAGKSTLLKVIAGVLKQSEGEVTKTGNVVPLLELGAGFDMQYSGAENIYLYGSMLGYPKDFIKAKYDEIVEFADLGEFINMPVKNYSSGMRARLGFAIATVVEPDILILDEVLSVGDAAFKKKSEKKIMDMFDKGTTVLFVSHNEDQVRKLCSKGIVLKRGKLVYSGTANEAMDFYLGKNYQGNSQK
ncbi:MAG: ABC transporter ATP-binding protein [Lachnospiraceae bacterium]|jgi:ABC-2 type transport system ATP-binding protein|nr:ABC transporter ATP-binding protein [Lachnospiraceae bacterium]MBP5249688.1 ABC transporter ATP-binding protein [Lachnospiraceae bacterium]